MGLSPQALEPLGDQERSPRLRSSDVWPKAYSARCTDIAGHLSGSLLPSRDHVFTRNIF